ncbi:hypothetical protein C8Q76DRAFT_682816 [Earliella scabrosa]|nr:hypothetical protein C8Q76DRAFT_682816 [Earliella scabrosa]
MTFFPNHREKILFPFAAFEHNHHPTFPDIAVSQPGRDLTCADWQDISSLLQAKPEAGDDPFRKPGLKQRETLVQMAIGARGLTVSHGYLAAYMIGVYGENGRIVRFDHSAVVASPLFSLRKNPEYLQRFLWRFVHPIVGNTVVGCDPTSRQLTDAEHKWVVGRLQGAAEATSHEGGLCRRSEVFDTVEDDAPPRAFFLFRLIDINARLLSRATTVWLAIEDPRTLVNGNLSSFPEQPGDLALVIVKDAWRQLVRKNERVFYDRLAQTIPDDEWTALPRIQSCFSSPLTPIDATPPPTLRLPQQQTYTWRELVGETQRHRERSHTRLVIDTVGRRLTRFRSTCEFVLALRDAIRGHKLAWEKGKLLHRDVSVGNILIVDKVATRKFRGFLHDFDYSAMVPLAAPHDEFITADTQAGSSGLLVGGSELMTPDPARTTDPSDVHEDLKERTGTYYFIAIELLQHAGAVHNVHHDLQSFYWVFIWVVLRHTAYSHHLGKEACARYFKFGNDEASWGAKLQLLWSPSNSITVPQNAPLTRLIDAFTSLVRDCVITSRQGADSPLTHDAILKLFDEALASEGWPEGDAAIPVTLEDTRKTDLHFDTKAGAPSGSKRSKTSSMKRKEKHDADDSGGGSSKRSKTTSTGSRNTGSRSTRASTASGQARSSRSGKSS